MDIKILVPTQKQLKIEAIASAFRKSFPEDEIIISSIPSFSDVPRQPSNNDVFVGAVNRICNSKDFLEEDFDYIVSCEGGLINQFGKWFNIQVVVLEDKNGNRFSGLSSGFEVPEKYVPMALETSIRVVMDEVFGLENNHDFLPGGRSFRKQLIEEATTMAISSTNWR